VSATRAPPPTGWPSGPKPSASQSSTTTRGVVETELVVPEEAVEVQGQPVEDGEAHDVQGLTDGAGGEGLDFAAVLGDDGGLDEGRVGAPHGAQLQDLEARLGEELVQSVAGEAEVWVIRFSIARE